jgi:hypothetical protein
MGLRYLKTRLALVFALALLPLAGCNDFVGHDIKQWKELSVPEADFKIVMPPDPSRQMPIVTAPNGGAMTGTVFEAKGSDWNYLVGWIDLGLFGSYDFDKGVASTAAQFDGKVVEQNSTVVNGYPAVQFTMSINKPFNGTAVERIVYVNVPSKSVNRVYMVAAAGVKLKPSDRTARKLFESFTLTLPAGPR